MKIIETYKQLKYNLTYCPKRSIKYIVIHNTGTTASAQNNCKYFGSGNRNASADYFVNTDGSIYLFNANIKNYCSWHCGDGKGKYGITNANSIGIEVVSAGTAFTSAQITALRELVLNLMNNYKIPSTNLVRHYDASRKSCPAYYVDSARWNNLKSSLLNVQKASNPFLVRVKVDSLNVRAGAGTSYPVRATIKKNEVYTIVETNGSWGKLKSGIGWINISSSYVNRI